MRGEGCSAESWGLGCAPGSPPAGLRHARRCAQSGLRISGSTSTIGSSASAAGSPSLSLQDSGTDSDQGMRRFQPASSVGTPWASSPMEPTEEAPGVQDVHARRRHYRVDPGRRLGVPDARAKKPVAATYGKGPDHPLGVPVVVIREPG